MARARRSSGLAELERKLAQVDAERERIVAAIRAALNSLMGEGSGARRLAVVGVGKPVRAARRFSPAVRKRLSELAKARWAKAKKAGQTRL